MASSRTALIAALAGNVMIAITKSVAAAVSGSSAMLSEAVHSFVDSGNEILLLYGQHRAERPSDETHPLGYGREIYFWSFIVALLIFTAGAGVSAYQGVSRMMHPEPLGDPLVDYIVYGFAALFEGISWSFGWSAFQRVRGDKGIMAAVHQSKDPRSFMVLFEDSAALIGIAIAVTATVLGEWLSAPWLDGLASLLIGLVLALVALLLGRESKALLIGEPASDALTSSLRQAALRQAGVIAVEQVVTTQLAPDQVIATLSLTFDERLDVGRLERLIAHIEQELRSHHPDLFRVFVRPTPPAAVRPQAAMAAKAAPSG